MCSIDPIFLYISCKRTYNLLYSYAMRCYTTQIHMVIIFMVKNVNWNGYWHGLTIKCSLVMVLLSVFWGARKMNAVVFLVNFYIFLLFKCLTKGKAKCYYHNSIYSYILVGFIEVQGLILIWVTYFIGVVWVTVSLSHIHNKIIILW